MAESVALPSFDGNEIAKNGGSASCGYSGPDFKVSGIFSSHMVLQRDKPIRVFGFSSRPGSIVSGEFDGEIVSAFVGTDNKWRLTFSPRSVNRSPLSMKFSDDSGNSAVFDDILIGDVWLIGGQSNAELHLGPCVAANPGLTFDENDSFRLFQQTQAYPYQHKELCNAPQDDIINPDWRWKRPDEQSCLEFSAMAYFFVRELMKKIDIPQGLVMCCAGGACLREMVPEGLAHATGYLTGANVPIAGYYNTLINPLIGLNFRGQLFFQGESEGCWRSFADNYARDLALLVYDERIRFGFDFPFYNVQISNYPKDGPRFFPYTDIVRVEQFRAFDIIGNYTLTVDMDLGAHEEDPDWAHSPHKAELGRRLAALVLAREYGIGKEEEANSPMPEGAVLSDDGKSVIVKFANTNGALNTVQGNSTVRGFTFGQRDSLVPAEAEIISGSEVKVIIPEGCDYSSVGYTFFITVNKENSNLRGGTGLPVPAFLIGVNK